ncbi:MAG: lactate utilization protein [Eubacteriales bacterium]|jgi:L-lactate utilization protein LutB
MEWKTLQENFTKKGFTVKIFKTGAEAVEYLKQEIQGTTVAFGGSVTLQQLGAYEALSQGNQMVWHWKCMTPEVMRLAQSAKVFLTSANGVAETGELVNIDGRGNRVAMSLFGPERTYYVVGQNKIAPDLHAAIHRAQNIAAPKNAQRLGKKTPCAVKADRCYDCNSPERICNGTVIIQRPMTGMHTELIVIEEELGY